MTSSLRRQLLSCSLSAAGLGAAAGMAGGLSPVRQAMAAAGAALATGGRQQDGLLVPALTSLPAMPASLSLDFDVFYGDFTGSGFQVAQAVYRLIREQDQYRLDTEAHATGMLAVFYSGTLLQSSTGALGAQGFLPHRYTEKRGRRPERQLTFDTRARRVRPGGDAGAGFPFPEGTQDRLSVFFQLGLLARSHEAVSRPGQRFMLPLAGMNRIDEPLFQVISREPLRTNAGHFEALHIAASKPGDHDAPKFDVWLAPELKMMPVRIRVVEGRDKRVIDQVLKKRPAGV